MEDEDAQRAGKILHVYLDDCGNVVRQNRVDSDEVSNFEGSWFEGSWVPSFEDEAIPVGSTYLPGGLRGPPYG